MNYEKSINHKEHKGDTKDTKMKIKNKVLIIVNNLQFNL